MSDALHEALIAAHAHFEEEGDDDRAYELETAIRMFAPHQGDDPETARARKVSNANCGNCDFTWPAMAMPAPLMDAATTGLRFSKCPRCFATQEIFLKQS